MTNCFTHFFYSMNYKKCKKKRLIKAKRGRGVVSLHQSSGLDRKQRKEK